MHHPFADRHDQPGLLGQRDEHGGADHAQFGVLPAHQRLHAHDVLGLGIDLGLIDHAQLAVAFGVAQARLQRHAVLARVLRTDLVDLEVVAALVLGRIHRLVRMLEQGIGVVGVVGEKAHAHRHGDLQLHAVFQEDRRLHHLHDLLGHAQHVVVLDDVAQHDGELVARIARHRVGGADAAAQALGDGAQHLIAGGMAVGVVDGLEPVQVDEQQGEALAVADRLAQDRLQPVVEQQPVGQPGQGIDQALGATLFAGALQLQRAGETRRRATQHRLDHRHLGETAAAAGEHGAEHAVPLVVHRQADEAGQIQLLQQRIDRRQLAGVGLVTHRLPAQHQLQRTLQVARRPLRVFLAAQLQDLGGGVGRFRTDRPHGQIVQRQLVEQQLRTGGLRVDAAA